MRVRLAQLLERPFLEADYERVRDRSLELKAFIVAIRVATLAIV